MEEVDGFLGRDEWLVLYYFGRTALDGGVIVEIGSYKGRSTIELARGSMDGPEIMVYAVDHFKGSEEHKLNGKDINTFPEFLYNITNANVKHLISPLVKDSVTASKDFDKQISVLFIDGSHKYEDVKADFDNWSPKIIKGGVLAFHDSNWEDVADVIEEVKDSGKFTDFIRSGTIAFARKL